jgi:hypothetical protein
MVDDPEPSLRAAEWRTMAERVRALAASIGHPLAQDNLMHMVREWERLADQIERRRSPFAS